MDLFLPDAWQPSIVQTLKEYCRLHKAKTDGLDMFGKLLQMASELRSRVEKLSLEGVLPDGRDGWFPIVGIGSPTQVAVHIGAKWFDFLDPENDGERTGDGTVPFLGACPAFLERERLACVTPDDFSMWEIQDRALAAAAGFHGALPTVNLVQRLVIKFLLNKFSGDVWARRAPGADGTKWPGWLKEA